MKRISKKNRYIADLLWEINHFETELKMVKPFSETGKFSWIYYLGDQFTISKAKQRVKELKAEIEHVQSDDSYTPWKDDFNFEQHTIKDIKENLDQQEIPDCSPAGEPNPPDEEPHYGPGDGVIYSIMKDREKGQGVHPSMYEATCPACGKTTSDWSPESGSGVCTPCEKEGKWTDPAGGVHDEDEEDPAAQYE